MNRCLIRNVRLVRPGEDVAPGSVLLEDGRIGALNPSALAPDTPVVEGDGRLLTPGLIDLHTHGIGTHVYENGPEALQAGAACLARYGTTTVLPTIVPDLKAGMLARLARLAGALDGITGVAVPGLHLEGPFVAVTGAACATAAGDVGLLEELLAAGGGRIKAMSVSPETPGVLPVIRRLREQGVVPMLTHTRATVAQTQAAMAAGALHATHFYDVFPVPAESDPGVRPAGAVEALLAEPRASVDFIADGCHVDPVVIRMAVRAKGWANVLLITDSNIGAGLPEGEYPTPWGYPVRTAPGRGARIADPRHPGYGGLAGSALTMDAGLRHLLAWLPLAPAQVWAMGTANPARLLGLNKGRLAVGADADLVLWDDALSPAMTWVSGSLVFPWGESA